MCVYFTAYIAMFLCVVYGKKNNSWIKSNWTGQFVYCSDICISCFLNFCTSQDKKEISNNKIHITFDANDRLIQNLNYDLFYFLRVQNKNLFMLYSLIPHHPYIGACSLLTFKFFKTFALPRKIFFLPYFIFWESHPLCDICKLTRQYLADVFT